MGGGEGGEGREGGCGALRGMGRCGRMGWREEGEGKREERLVVGGGLSGGAGR